MKLKDYCDISKWKLIWGSAWNLKIKIPAVFKTMSYQYLCSL